MSVLSLKLSTGPSSAQITVVDDWCLAHKSHDAKFSPTPEYRLKDGVGRIECKLTCSHNDNYVSASGYGMNTGDAFMTALGKIESTIGRVWRGKR